MGGALSLSSLSAWSNTPDTQSLAAPNHQSQEMEFLAFLAFLGNIASLESAGVDVDQVLANPVQSILQPPPTPSDDNLPKRPMSTNQ